MINKKEGNKNNVLTICDQYNLKCYIQSIIFTIANIRVIDA